PIPVPGLTKKTCGRRVPLETSENHLRQWKCFVDECGYSFVCKAHLKRHIISVHTNEKYTCLVPGCDRMFSRADNLKKHLPTHK
ncbi:hypothetical protein J3A83DRAFT_4072541, partial [Scleroderma citrinum]